MHTQHCDVLIIGAGLSGIGAACHLKRECPDKSVLILESRLAMGGTWDLFRYPGIRSDSDMYTLGYSFKPWTNPKAIADGPSIRDYIRDTAREHGVDRLVRYGLRVKRAAWSSQDATWTIEAEKTDGEISRFTCNFILSCTGYYNYEKGYTPDFPGRDRFTGTFIHPQHWPEDLNYAGKRIVVIGSGATAVTLVPALSEQAAKVTMLQRSPTYVVSVPQEDVISNKLREYLPDTAVYRLARARNVGISLGLYQFSRKQPERMRKFVLSQIEKKMPAGFDMRHFSPKYNPWDERLCVVPNGDLFKAIRKGRADVVTDHIDTFTEKGIKLKSGQELEADIVVSATGLDIQLMGGAQLSVDGKPFSLADRLYYKGVMFEGLPNLGMVFGYTNASWTLKADLTCEYVCRLLKHMDRTGERQCMPRNRDATVERRPFVDLASGYIQRAGGKVPAQGSKAPWKLYQNYMLDMATLRYSKLEDGVLEFSNRGAGVRQRKAALLASA